MPALLTIANILGIFGRLFVLDAEPEPMPLTDLITIPTDRRIIAIQSPVMNEGLADPDTTATDYKHEVRLRTLEVAVAILTSKVKDLTPSRIIAERSATHDTHESRSIEIATPLPQLQPSKTSDKSHFDVFRDIFNMAINKFGTPKPLIPQKPDTRTRTLMSKFQGRSPHKNQHSSKSATNCYLPQRYSQSRTTAGRRDRKRISTVVQHTTKRMIPTELHIHKPGELLFTTTKSTQRNLHLCASCPSFFRIGT